jgi:two-component system sensor histidine kinase TctE
MSREQRSLFGEILDWMLAPLLLLWPMSVALTWLVAQGIANQPYDRELGERARLLATRIAVTDAGQRGPRVLLTGELPAGDETDRVYVQVLGVRRELLAGEGLLPPPEGSPNNLGEVQFRDGAVNEEAVRIAYLWLADGPLAAGEAPPLVQVAETLEKRSRLATEIIKGVILPQFVILPLAVLLVWLALARGIAPLNALQQRIRERDSHDLSPIADRDVPEEVSPLVRSINELLGRLDRSIRAQKQFLADAAHQLKTPLAGLRMQAELAQREIDTGEADAVALKQSLQQIARSSTQAAHMVNQLLALARAEDKEQALRRHPVPLVALAGDTVRELLPRALDKRIDLGYDGPAADDDTTTLRGQPVLARELVRNLADNALKYTPAGGEVTLRVVPDPFGQVVVLQVDDSGPGIPTEERELVFQPFYRSLGTNVDGSGLGLAIVREIALRHGATVTVDQSPAGGTRMTVRFLVEPGEGTGPAGAVSSA